MTTRIEKEDSGADRNTDDAAAAAAAKLWTSALASPPPRPLSSSSELLRRLGICGLVHEVWTLPRNGGEAGAADKWFDHSVDVLEAFVSSAAAIAAAAAAEEEEHTGSAVDVVRDGAALNGPGGLSALFAASKVLPGPSQRPALLVGAAEGWRCARLWRKKETSDSSSTSSPSSSLSSSVPDWQGFASTFPEGERGRLADGRRKGAGPDARKKVEVSEAVALIGRYSRDNDHDDADADTADDDEANRPLPYLKDLQCSQAHPRGFLDDARPHWASGDEWLGDGADSWEEEEEEEEEDDEGEDENGDDRGDGDDNKNSHSVSAPRRPRPPSYRFVYAGPRGASTPWHCDVYGSCAWSANVAGWKKWTFLSPEDAPLLYSRFGHATAKWFADDGGDDTNDSVSFPWLVEARKRSFSVVQGPGDIVFVPPAWWHCVENVAAAAAADAAPHLPDSTTATRDEKNDKERDFGSISINVNFLAGPVACAAAWEDSVLREHEEALRKVLTSAREYDDDERDDDGDDDKHNNGDKKKLSASFVLPPLPPLPARQVDGTTLSSTSMGSLSSTSAQGIGIGGFVALALGAAQRAAVTVAAAAAAAAAASEQNGNEKGKENKEERDVEPSLPPLLPPLSRVSLARAAVSARSARSVLLGAALYARRAAIAAASAAAALAEEEEEEENKEESERALASRFLEGITLVEVERAAQRAKETVEAAAKLLGVVPQF